MEELKVTPGDWWLSGNEIIAGIHTKVAKIHPTNMNDPQEHKRNGRLLVNSKKMFELLRKINSEFYDYKAFAQGTNKAGLIFETENLINEILEK